MPASMVMGSVQRGSTPASPEYSASFPTGMPMPLAPKSPRPKMRSPSVTQMTRTGIAERQVRSTSATRPASPREMYSPKEGGSSMRDQDWHAAPTTGV